MDRSSNPQSKAIALTGCFVPASTPAARRSLLRNRYWCGVRPITLRNVRRKWYGLIATLLARSAIVSLSADSASTRWTTALMRLASRGLGSAWRRGECASVRSTALHLLTGARVTEDVDATFSRRVLLDQDIEVSYRDADGRARLMYLDRNYNDTLGLLHENAYRDSRKIDVPGIDRKLLEVRVLAPVDLAVTKLARFTDQDREDIRHLARKRLIDSAAVRKRAEETLKGYVGDAAPLRTSIDVACRLIDAERPPGPPRLTRKRG